MANGSIVVPVDTGGPVDEMVGGLEAEGFFCAQVRANDVARQAWCRGDYSPEASGGDLWASTVDIVATQDGQLQYLRITPPYRITHAGGQLGAHSDTRLAAILSASVLRAWPEDSEAALGLIDEVRRASRGGFELGNDPRKPERASVSADHADYFVGEGSLFSDQRRTSGAPPLTFIAATDALEGPWPVSSAHSLTGALAAAPGLESAGFTCLGPSKNPCRLPDTNQAVYYYTAPGSDTVISVNVSINGGTNNNGDAASLSDVGFANGLTFLTEEVRGPVEARIEQARRDGQSFLGIVAGTLIDIDATVRPAAAQADWASPVTVRIGAPLVPRQ